MRVADYIIRRLEGLTRHVFLLVGGGSMHLNDALYGSKLQPVFMLHEQGAAFAAQTYGHLTGLGVCMTVSLRRERRALLVQHEDRRQL